MSSKIIYATDFSIPSTRGSDTAAALAAKTGETLILLHVCEPTHAAGETLSSSLHLAAKHRLHAEANRLRMTGAEVEELVLDGSPSSNLLSALDTTEARLLIIASQEKRSLPARWFSGGLIERIVKHSNVPTLVIRDADSIEEWLSGTKPLRIVVATGPALAADIPLHWVRELAKCGPCEVIATYLHWVPDEAIRLGLPPTAFFENSRQLQVLLEKELKEKTDEILGDLPVTIRIEPRCGRADYPIIGIADPANADLIVTGTRLRGSLARLFDESISLDLLHHAPTNLAIVPLRESAVQKPIPVYDHILVPVDFSDPSRQAISHACAIADRGATIHLLHVTDRFGISLPDGTKKLQDFIPQEAIDRGLKFETIIEEGDSAAETILQISARRMADVICMGTTGAGTLSKTILGSVASAVISTSPRPVFLIPKHV